MVNGFNVDDVQTNLPSDAAKSSSTPQRSENKDASIFLNNNEPDNKQHLSYFSYMLDFYEAKKQEPVQPEPVQPEPVQPEPALPAPALITQNSDVRASYDWSEKDFKDAFDQMLNDPKYKGKFKNSVLQGKANAFIESGKKYDVDPRILVAIAMHESGRGMSNLAQKFNNVGGIVINGRMHKFESIEACIDSIAKTISTRYQEGYTTAKKIGQSGKYCAKHEGSTWVRNVSSYLKSFDTYYFSQREDNMA